MNDWNPYRGLGNIPGVQSATVRKSDFKQMLYSVTDCLCLAVFCIWVQGSLRSSFLPWGSCLGAGQAYCEDSVCIISHGLIPRTMYQKISKPRTVATMLSVMTLCPGEGRRMWWVSRDLSFSCESDRHSTSKPAQRFCENVNIYIFCTVSYQKR